MLSVIFFLQVITCEQVSNLRNLNIAPTLKVSAMMKSNKNAIIGSRHAMSVLRRDGGQSMP